MKKFIKMIEDTSNNSKNSKYLIICKKCLFFPELEKIFFLKDEIWIKFKCNCNNGNPTEMNYDNFLKFHKISIEKQHKSFTKNNTQYIYKFLTSNNNYCEVFLNYYTLPNKCFGCYYSMSKITRIFFCGKCKNFYGPCCGKYHSSHKVIEIQLDKKEQINTEQIISSYYKRQETNEKYIQSLLKKFSSFKKGSQKKNQRCITLIKENYENNLKETQKLLNLFLCLRNNYMETLDAIYSTNMINMLLFERTFPGIFEDKFLKFSQKIENFLLFCKNQFWVLTKNKSYFNRSPLEHQFIKEVKGNIRYGCHLKEFGNIGNHFFLLDVCTKILVKKKLNSSKDIKKCPGLTWITDDKYIKQTGNNLMIYNYMGILSFVEFMFGDSYEEFYERYTEWTMGINRIECDDYCRLHNGQFAICIDSKIHILSKYKYEYLTIQEESIINSIFQLNNGLLLSNLENIINFWDLKTCQVQYSIHFKPYCRRYVIIKYYEVQSKNLLIINLNQFLLVISTKTYQIVTILLKEWATNIGIISDTFLVYKPDWRNSINVINLNTSKIISTMYLSNLKNFVQIDNERFLFYFSYMKKEYIKLYYI